MTKLEQADKKYFDVMTILSFFRFSPDLYEYDQEDYEQLCREATMANDLQFKAYGGRVEAIKEYVEFIKKLNEKTNKWLKHEKIGEEPAPENV